MRKLVILIAALTLAAPLLFYGCSGDDGAAGTSAPTTGTLAGVVSDAIMKVNPPTDNTPVALSGVDVWATETQGGTLASATYKTQTDATGHFSLSLPNGGWYVYMSKQYYLPPGGMFVGIGGGMTTQLNASISEAASGAPSFSIAAQAGDDFGYGNTITVVASANGNFTAPTDPNDNVSTLKYTWSNSTATNTRPDGTTFSMGSVVGGTGAAANTATVTFPTIPVAFQPRYTKSSNTTISGYKLPDRFGIIPVFPDIRGTVGVRLTVTDPRAAAANSTTTGIAKPVVNTLSLNAASITTGTRSIPLGARVYMNGGAGPTYNWTLTPPSGSGITLDNATTRTPGFKAVANGAYILTDNVSGGTITLTTGTYAGLITNGKIVGDLLKDGTATDLSAGNNCVCHNTVALDQATTWVKTRHAKILAMNWTTAADLPGESRTCIYCHSVGFGEGILAAGGFEAKMYAFDNLFFPYGVSVGGQPTFWTDLFTASPQKAAMAQLGNIQCENCHGPNNSALHTLTQDNAFASPRISFAAEVCAQCHGRTSHNFYSQWATPSASGAGHSNRQLAIDEAANAGSCARCHGAQGFTIFVDHLESGNFGNPSTTEYAGVTAKNVEPITCTACHDPHNVQYLFNADGSPKLLPSSGTNPDGTPRPQRQATNNQLRVYNETGLLPAGFRVTGFGKGALCVTCHNTRNGAQTGSTTNTYLHEDGTPASNGGSYNSGNPTSFSAPHTAAQGDVLAGRNAWFMGTGNLPMLSRHAAVEDVCVGCHMKSNPNKIIGELGLTSQSHRFGIYGDLVAFCSNCHGEDKVNGEAIQAGVESSLELLGDKMAASLMAKLAATSTGSPFYMTIYPTDNNGNILLNASGGEVQSDNAAFVYNNTNVATAISVVEPHGQIGFLVTLTNPASITVSGVNYTFSKFEVQLGKIFNVAIPGTTPADVNTVYKLNGNMVRAGWNYFLLEGDGSKGIHNPTFAQQVLNATLKQDLSN